MTVVQLIDLKAVCKPSKMSISCYNCLNSYTAKNHIVNLHCDHLYHATCINKWIDRSDLLIASCAVCRQPIFTEPTRVYLNMDLGLYRQLINQFQRATSSNQQLHRENNALYHQLQEKEDTVTKLQSQILEMKKCMKIDGHQMKRK